MLNNKQKQKSNTKANKNALETAGKDRAWVRFCREHAFIIFLVCLTALVCLIVGNEYLSRQHIVEEEAVARVTDVSTYRLAQAYLTTQARVVDEGVVNVLVQTSAGVVQKVNVSEGDHVSRGQQLARLSDTYGGANASALQLELAQKNWLVTHANYWDQEKVDDINLELNRNSAWMTRWETNGGSGSRGNGDAYTSYAGQQNQELLTITDTMSQRGQQLSLDQAENSYFQAQIAASLMYPTTPVAGTIQKVNVSVGQMVSAGSVVAIVKADQTTVKLKLTVGENIIRVLDVSKQAYFDYNGQSYPVELDYLPVTPTTGNSYDLIFTLPDELATLLPNGSFVPMRLPLETVRGEQLLVPLNSIYQTQIAAYAYVVDRDERGELIARQTPVQLGAVIGDLVTVTSGLNAQDEIILNNNLLDGTRINIINVSDSALTTNSGLSEASPAAKITLE